MNKNNNRKDRRNVAIRLKIQRAAAFVQVGVDIIQL